MSRPLRVFLCHSSNDKPAVRELYQKLRAENWIEAWLDEEELYPGEDWEIAIEKAVENSDVILVCLSNGSINKRGFVQKELRLALDVALEMPEETVFIIPLRLEECTPPRNLKGWHYADYFEGQRERGLQRLLVSLKRRADSLGLKSEPVAQEEKQTLRSQTSPLKPVIETPITNLTLSNGMELMRVPAGKFIMGSNNGYDNEKPQHTVDIPYNYWMARFTVTNQQYNEFCQAKNIKHPVSGWQKKRNYPVTYVKWKDAMAYCKWLNALLKNELPKNYVLRLPTEAEWEKAARGTDGREYTWGNQEPNKNLLNYDGNVGDTTPVGGYSPQGDSSYGCADISGNVWEWTHSLYEHYPYNAKDGREGEKVSGSRGLRGGSWSDDGGSARVAIRYYGDPHYRDLSIGFRVCAASIAHL